MFLFQVLGTANNVDTAGQVLRSVSGRHPPALCLWFQLWVPGDGVCRPEVSSYSCLLLELATGREEQDNSISIRAGNGPSSKNSTPLLSGLLSSELGLQMGPFPFPAIIWDDSQDSPAQGPRRTSRWGRPLQWRGRPTGWGGWAKLLLLSRNVLTACSLGPGLQPLACVHILGGGGHATVPSTFRKLSVIINYGVSI